MRAFAALVLAASLMIATPVQAQPPGDGLSYFEGLWHDVDDGCVLQVSRGVSDSLWVFSWSAGTLADLRHIRGCGDAKAWAGFDAEAGAWVDYGMAVDGTTWKATSRGWTGEALVWHGATFDRHGNKIVARRTFERRTAAAFSVRVEISEDGTTWRDLGRTAFVRGAPPDGAV